MNMDSIKTQHGSRYLIEADIYIRKAARLGGAEHEESERRKAVTTLLLNELRNQA